MKSAACTYVHMYSVARQCMHYVLVLCAFAWPHHRCGHVLLHLPATIASDHTPVSTAHNSVHMSKYDHKTSYHSVRHSFAVVVEHSSNISNGISSNDSSSSIGSENSSSSGSDSTGNTTI
eukprot:11752-Heterococcus_DN1.PRE.3